MTAPTPVIRQEQEQDRKLKEAIAKALDFSEAYAAIERAEKIATETLAKYKKDAKE